MALPSSPQCTSKSRIQNPKLQRHCLQSYTGHRYPTARPCGEGRPTDLLREMIRFGAQRLMELEVESLTGAGYEKESRSARFSTTATAIAIEETRAGRIALRFPSCARAATLWLPAPLRGVKRVISDATRGKAAVAKEASSDALGRNSESRHSHIGATPTLLDYASSHSAAVDAGRRSGVRARTDAAVHGKPYKLRHPRSRAHAAPQQQPRGRHGDRPDATARLRA